MRGKTTSSSKKFYVTRTDCGSLKPSKDSEEHDFVVKKYISAHPYALPPGSLQRRLWRGYSCEGIPIGCAIVSYCVSQGLSSLLKYTSALDFESLCLPEGSIPREKPSSLVEIDKQRQVKRPSAIIAEANFAVMKGQQAVVPRNPQQIYNR